jgi:hypothetical protein
MSHGESYEEPAPSRAVRLSSPNVFGAAGKEPLSAISRTMFFCVLRDVYVSSKSNFILTDDAALLDFQANELEKCPLNLDVDPLVMACEENVAVIQPKQLAGLRHFECALSHLGVHSSAFGHWLIEFLPKVWVCLDLPRFASVTLLIDEQMPPQHREALQLFVGPEHPVTIVKPRETVHVDRLWTCPMPFYLPVGPQPGTDSASDLMVTNSEFFAPLLKKATRRLEAVDATARRNAFISREKARSTVSS